MQTVDRRRFNTGLSLSLGLAGCASVSPSGPDLVVTGLRWSEDAGASWHTGPVQAGSNVWFEADVENRGTGPTPDGVIIGVGFRANGTMVAWSDDHTQSIPAGASLSLRANGGPDGDRYWNAVQAGSYTIRVHVDDINRIPDELDETNNTLDVQLAVQGGTGGSITVGSVSGGGNVYKGDAASYKIGDLAALHCGVARLALYPDNDYFSGEAPSPSRADDVVLALLKNGIRPYVSFEWYSDWVGGANRPDQNYADWFSIGNAFATRFRPNSPFLVGQGITDFGIVEWAAINEVDRKRGEDPSLSYTQYHAMIQGLADGVHAVDPTAKVYPAGYLSANRDNEYTGHGYLPAVSDLINDGTLAGFDIHTYVDKLNAPIFDRYNDSHQHDFDSFASASGITRIDIDSCCTEYNVKADPDAASQGYDEPTARRWFLTHFFNVCGVVRSDGTWAPGARLAWNIWTSSPTAFHLAKSVDPRVPRWCGHTHKMLLELVHDMAFVANDPNGTGTYKLQGGGKTAWVFQNIHSSWSSLFGSSFTINDIPAAATKIDVYDGMGLVETVNNPGTSHVFSTPTGRSYLFIADAVSADTTISANGVVRRALG